MAIRKSNYDSRGLRINVPTWPSRDSPIKITMITLLSLLFSLFSPPWNVGERATVIGISHFISCWYISRVKVWKDNQRRRLTAIFWGKRNTDDRSALSIRCKNISVYSHCIELKINSSFEIEWTWSRVCNRCIWFAWDHLLSGCKLSL